MRILRQSEFVPVPWKNGGGMTREVIRMPPDGDSFRWRVSIAQIDASGPFSDFAAYRRYMVLLQGSGVRLSFSSRGQAQGAPERRELRAVGDCVRFDGALATYCELLEGPCVDFNLMVAKGLPEPAVRVVAPSAVQPSSLPGDESLLLFPLNTCVRLERDGVREVLDPWDLALVAGGDLRELRIAAAGAGDMEGCSKVLLATLPCG